MLKKIAFSAFVFSLFSLPLLLAQQTTTPDAPTKSHMGRNRGIKHQAVDPATRAQKMTDRMTRQLNLDEATSKKVYELTLARAEKIEAIHKNNDDRKVKAQAAKASADEFNSQLKGILTAEQYAKFESMRSKMGKGRRTGVSPDGPEGNNQK